MAFICISILSCRLGNIFTTDHDIGKLLLRIARCSIQLAIVLAHLILYLFLAFYARLRYWHCCSHWWVLFYSIKRTFPTELLLWSYRMIFSILIHLIVCQSLRSARTCLNVKANIKFLLNLLSQLHCADFLDQRHHLIDWSRGHIYFNCFFTDLWLIFLLLLFSFKCFKGLPSFICAI